tara:strand:- start:476 stop:652 length:177 start_codon:yes stop_codon:yes gene_type:complete
MLAGRKRCTPHGSTPKTLSLSENDMDNQTLMVCVLFGIPMVPLPFIIIGALVDAIRGE